MTYFDKPLAHFFLPGADEEEQAATGIVMDQPTGRQTPIVERIREGLPLSEFEALQKLLDLPEDTLAKSLGLSAATLHRRKKAHRLASPESERLVRLTRLFGLAMEVLGSEQAARSWFKAENPGLAGESPLSYSDTDFGAREVENLLGRIDYGISA